MRTCKECEYGEYSCDNGEEYYWCYGTGDIVDIEIAEDETYECDLYVKKLDDNKTKKSSA